MSDKIKVQLMKDGVQVGEDVLKVGNANTPIEAKGWNTGQFEGFEKHLHHSLYREASKTWLAEQIGQIKKGAEKYPEPLKPAAWTFEELFKHAVQENVDQMHYLQAMFEKNQEEEKNKERLLNDLVGLEKKNAYLQDQLEKALETVVKLSKIDKECDDWEAENQVLKAELSSLKESGFYQKEENEQLKKDVNHWHEYARSKEKRIKELIELSEDRAKDVMHLVNREKELEQANRELLQQNETVQHLQQENAELRAWKEQATDVMKQAAVRLLDDAIEKWLRK